MLTCLSVLLSCIRTIPSVWVIYSFSLIVVIYLERSGSSGLKVFFSPLMFRTATKQALFASSSSSHTTKRRSLLKWIITSCGHLDCVVGGTKWSRRFQLIVLRLKEHDLFLVRNGDGSNVTGNQGDVKRTVGQRMDINDSRVARITADDLDLLVPTVCDEKTSGGQLRNTRYFAVSLS